MRFDGFTSFRRLLKKSLTKSNMMFLENTSGKHDGLSSSNMLTLNASFMTIVVFVASVDQDQAAQNVQSDL